MSDCVCLTSGLIEFGAADDMAAHNFLKNRWKLSVHAAEGCYAGCKLLELGSMVSRDFAAH